MKGIVFTEFLEMVEDRFDPDMADRIIESSALESKGVYTAVGTYDPGEMVLLVGALSRETGVGVPDLLRTFGQHLFGRFVVAYPQFFTAGGSALDFLEGIEGTIHAEVRKLYPDAELPHFECNGRQDGSLTLTYASQRPFAVLAEGLIRGCVQHFGEPMDVAVEDLSEGRGTRARFVLTRRGDGA